MQSASALDWCTEEVREHILKVDFEWDEFGDGFRWDDVIAGLTLYKTLYGELPDDEFKVRSNEAVKTQRKFSAFFVERISPGGELCV